MKLLATTLCALGITIFGLCLSSQAAAQKDTAKVPIETYLDIDIWAQERAHVLLHETVMTKIPDDKPKHSKNDSVKVIVVYRFFLEEGKVKGVLECWLEPCNGMSFVTAYISLYTPYPAYVYRHPFGRHTDVKVETEIRLRWNMPHALWVEGALNEDFFWQFLRKHHWTSAEALPVFKGAGK